MLLGAGWTLDRLEPYLRAVAAMPGSAGRVDKARDLMNALVRYAHVSASDIDGWVRWTLRGNLSLLDALSGVCESWRATHDDPSAAAEAAGRACAWKRPATHLYVPAARGRITKGDSLKARQDLWETRFSAWAQQSPLGTVLTDVPDLPPERVGTNLRRLVSAGWTLDSIAEHVAAAPNRTASLLGIGLTAYLTASERPGWTQALRLTGVTVDQRADLYPLRRLVMVWRASGVPEPMQPWCAAAGLDPLEADRAVAASTLTLTGVRMLAGLVQS